MTRPDYNSSKFIAGKFSVGSNQAGEAIHRGGDVTMGISRSSLNVLTNIVSAVLNVAASLAVVPFLVKQLGAETYGLWALITATTGYFYILDFGVMMSVGRLIVRYRARDDIGGLNNVVATATVLFTAICLVICLVTLGASIVFFQVFHVPSVQAADVQHALMINGFAIAMFFLGAVFNAILWGCERFYLMNSVDAAVLLARMGLIFWVLRSGGSLEELSILTFFGQLASALLYAILCWRVEPRLSIKLSHFSLRMVKEIFHFGIFFSVLNTARALTTQIGTVIIGHGLDNRTVATFSIAKQLALYSNAFILSVTQVATPRAAVFHFGAQIDRQRALFIEGGRYATALSCFFALGFFGLGAPFLTVWQSGRQDAAYLPLVILITGEIIPMSQWVTNQVVVSVGKHRLLAAFAILEGAAIIALALALIRPFGMIGVCMAIGFSGFVFRGLCTWIYGCRLLQIPPQTYARKVFLPVLVPSVIQLGLFSLLRVWPAPSSWVELVFAGAIYSLTYLLLLSPVLFGWRELAQYARMLVRRIVSAV